MASRWGRTVREPKALPITGISQEQTSLPLRRRGLRAQAPVATGAKPARRNRPQLSFQRAHPRVSAVGKKSQIESLIRVGSSKQAVGTCFEVINRNSPSNPPAIANRRSLTGCAIFSPFSFPRASTPLDEKHFSIERSDTRNYCSTF